MRPPDGSSTVVIIPAFNEEQSIGQVIRSIPHEWIREIIVVDNGSVDHTAIEARSAGAVVLHEQRKGYGYACLRGIDRALALQADIIVFLDGDFSDYPEELPDLVRPILQEGFEMVVGSRMMGKRERGAMLPHAIFGNWLASRLIQLFWGYRFTDLGPFRAIQTRALTRLNMSEPTFGWTVEMQVKAAKLKLRCTEVPVRYRKRIGKSKVSGTLRGSIGASLKILSTIGKHLFVNVQA